MPGHAAAGSSPRGVERGVYATEPKGRGNSYGEVVDVRSALSALVAACCFAALILAGGDATAISCGTPAPGTVTTAPSPPIVVEGVFLGSEMRQVEYPTTGNVSERDVWLQEDEIFRFRVESASSPLIEVGGVADVRMFVNRRYVTEDGTELMSHTAGGFSRPPVEGYRYRVVADWVRGLEGTLLLADQACGGRGRLTALDGVPRQPPTTMVRDQSRIAVGDDERAEAVAVSGLLAVRGGSTSGSTDTPLGVKVAAWFALASVSTAAVGMWRRAST